MRFMIIVKASQDSEAGKLPSQELLAAMGQYNEELVKAGVLLSGEGLHPSSKGAHVRFSGDRRTVIDGPFTEIKELIAGYWLWQVQSKEEAIEWASVAPTQCPAPRPRSRSARSSRTRTLARSSRRSCASRKSACAPRPPSCRSSAEPETPMTRKLPTLTVVRALHPWSPVALCNQAGLVSPPLMCGTMCAPLNKVS
jgi:hypothetical protein